MQWPSWSCRCTAAGGQRGGGLATRSSGSPRVQGAGFPITTPGSYTSDSCAAFHLHGLSSTWGISGSVLGPLLFPPAFTPYRSHPVPWLSIRAVCRLVSCLSVAQPSPLHSGLTGALAFLTSPRCSTPETGFLAHPCMYLLGGCNSGALG